MYEIEQCLSVVFEQCFYDEIGRYLCCNLAMFSCN